MRLMSIVLFLVTILSAQSKSDEIYFENTIISSVSGNRDMPTVLKGVQKYIIRKGKLFITKNDGTEYLYGAIENTNQKLKFICGNKYLVFTDSSKSNLIVAHIDEIETRIIYLTKEK